MTPTCQLCDSRVVARGLCGAHYQSEAAAGRLSLHPKAVRAPIELAVNGHCPKHHRHGQTHTCYNAHGCRCVSCRRAKAKRRNRYDRRDRELRGRDVRVPAIGSIRRLRALAVIGWSVQEIANRAELFHRSLGKVREGSRAEVRKSTHMKIARVYADLENTPRVGREARITRTLALQSGWFPPAMWDNPDRDREPSDLVAGRSRA